MAAPMPQSPMPQSPVPQSPITVLPSFPKVHLDFGAIQALGGELAARNIARPLIITDEGLVEHGILDRVRAVMPGGAGGGEHAVFDAIPPNPTIAGVEGALARYREEGCDGIVGLGGGSVLDSGKALRVVATHGEPVIEYLKDPDKITADVAPYITIPTTAGTGAEITFGGGIHPQPNAHALSIRSMNVRPDVAICDPELTETLPPLLTAATGMDAFSHCFEGFVATTVNPPVDAIALDGIHRVVSYIERAVKDGRDREARWHMLMAALEGGMAIYKRLGPVHTLGHVFGDSSLHHGALVALCMPAVLRYYQGHVDDKLDRMAHAMGISFGDEVAAAVADLNARVGLPAGVRELGYPKNDLDALAETAAEGAFDATAPRKPTKEDYQQIIAEVLG